jgi:hypothetical protein
MRILRGDAFLCVDQQQRHIGAVDGAHTAQHAVLLDALLHRPRRRMPAVSISVMGCPRR